MTEVQLSRIDLSAGENSMVTIQQTHLFHNVSE